MAKTIERSHKLFPTFVGEWYTRWTVSERDHSGLVWTGPNPPFYPFDDVNGGFLTIIDSDGNGTIDFANTKLKGQFAGDHNQIYYGTWNDDEFGGRSGKFCLMITERVEEGDLFFSGMTETNYDSGKTSQAWQAWIGTRVKVLT